MQLKIKTTVSNCHLVVSVSVNGHSLINVQNKDEGTADLLPGVEYLFQWHAIAGSDDGSFSIDAVLSPLNNGFPPFHLNKQLGSGKRSDRAFSFTLNANTDGQENITAPARTGSHI